MTIPWITSSERMVGSGHETYEDTLNRALRAAMTASGLDPDAIFAGFVTLRPSDAAIEIFHVADFDDDIQAAVTAAFASTSGGIVRLAAKEYDLSTELVIPKSTTKSVTIEGAGMLASIIYWGTAVATGDPCCRYDVSVSGTSRHFGLRHLQLARGNGGPVFQMRQNVGNTGNNGDRFQFNMEHVFLSQSTSAGQDHTLDIEYAISARVSDVWFRGGDTAGVCFKLKNSSECYVEQPLSYLKAGAGNFLLIDGGGDHTVVHPRSEGNSDNGYVYKLLDCDHVTLVNPCMEGDLAKDSILLDGARFCLILNPSIGGQTGATNPYGIRFASTNRGCLGNQILGGWASGGFDALGTGVTIALDANASGNRVDRFTIMETTVATEVTDAGTDNHVTVIAGAGSPPTVQAPTASPLIASGFMTRGAACAVGSRSNHSVNIYKNDLVIATFDAGSLKIDGTKVLGVQGAAVADATDNASAILRLNELLARLRTHGAIAT